MFAVVDVETTGGHAAGHRMTEIAITVTDGERILHKFSTLLNPGRSIPLNIQALTGISPAMVADAPRFAEKASEIRAVLHDHIFVAHNVNFDFAFVRTALQECGIEYNPRRLCSVRYARRVKAGLRSYSLKNLCREFEVINESPHRAWGDADATAELLHKLLKLDTEKLWQQSVKKNSGEFNLPSHVPLEEYQKLPERPGVYYFLDQSGKPLYIGKAINLKKRVASHFISKKASSRSQAFKREIYHIDFQLTGSELLATLLEDHEIRHHWPIYNRAQKNPKLRFGIFHWLDQKNQPHLGVNRISGQQACLMEFYSRHQALSWLHQKMKDHQLDPAYCGFPVSSLNKVAAEDHRKGVEELLSSLHDNRESYIIRTRGREIDESGFAYVEKGKFSGIGFIPQHIQIKRAEELLDHLQKLRSSITTAAVLSKVVQDRKYEVISLRD